MIALITAAISEIRVYEQNQYYQKLSIFEKDSPAYQRAEDKYKLLKNSQRLLTTSPYNKDRFWIVNEGLRNERLNQIFSISHDLEIAYEALQAFYGITHEVHLSLRSSALSEWLETYLRSEVPALRRVAKSIDERRKGIEAAWHFKKSNAHTEGLNKKIKDIKRLGFGAHDFQRFRKRILLACGPVTFVHLPFSVSKEKNEIVSAVKGGL